MAAAPASSCPGAAGAARALDVGATASIVAAAVKRTSPFTILLSTEPPKFAQMGVFGQDIRAKQCHADRFGRHWRAEAATPFPSPEKSVSATDLRPVQRCDAAQVPPNTPPAGFAPA